MPTPQCAGCCCRGNSTKGLNIVAQKPNGKDEAVIIKKYANRRLYNTSTSTYVTLDDLAEMVKSGLDFTVKDAKSNEDITHSVLTQIIFEQESKGENMLPVEFLRQMIRFYGDGMQHIVPSFLTASAEMLNREQENLRNSMNPSFDTAPFAAMEEQVRQNMEAFKQTVSMFSPFTQPTQTQTPPPPPAEPEPSPAAPSEMEMLRDQLTRMQSQLDRMDKGKS